MLRILLFFILAWVILSGCSFSWEWMNHPSKEVVEFSQVSPLFEIVVLPHHNLTGKRIDEFYQDLKEKYRNFDQIFIISPDHYGFTRNPVESVPENLRQICYQESCVKAQPIDPYSHGVSLGSDYSETGETTEHGIGEHIKRIARFFPKSLVTPIILRRKITVWEAEKEIANTLANRSNKRVLVVTSVDFSHHVREEIAELHDKKSIDTLRFGKLEDFDSLEVDCRNCLAIAKMLALEKWKEGFHLIDRTSVDSLSSSGSDTENTSHIFWEFIDQKEVWNSENPESRDISQKDRVSGSGIFLFMGDSHWARWFPYYEKKSEWYREGVTRILYEKYDTANNLLTKYHRLLSGFDEVVVNLEAGIADPGSCIKSGKTTQMWMDPSLFFWFHELGITMANTANNHSHDCGNKLFLENKDRFLSGWITPFGYDEIAFRKIRGNTFAFIGIDTIETRPDIEKIQKNIQNLTSSGNLVIVNIHWWVEYSSGHTEKQREIGHKLIDAWARLIIGHHPHVVADAEIYRWIPIYYSLGNFLFDQPFPETLRWLMVGCEISKDTTSCTDISVYRDPKDYSLHF